MYTITSPGDDRGYGARAQAVQPSPARGHQAQVVDHSLRLLSRVDTLIDRAVGKGLVRISAANGLMKLGFANLEQYVTQRLGIGTRHAYDLRSMEERLVSRPLIDEAYQSGRLTYSHVLVLLARVGVEEDSEWVERACRLSVRALRDHLVKREGKASCEPSLDELMDGAGGRFVSLYLTRSQAAKLEIAIELARRQNGANLGVAACLELFMGEFLAGVGGAALASVDPNSLQTSRADEEEARRHSKRRRRWAQLERDMEAFTHHWSALSWDVVPPWVDVEIPTATDPYELDRSMRALVGLRQRMHSHFMRLLGDFDRTKLFRALGFASMRHYVTERLGMAASTARALLRLDFSLLDLPGIAQAFHRGEISQTQAEIIAEVATLANERKWIRLAGEVTTKRLREVVGAARSRDVWQRFPATDEAQMSATGGAEVEPTAMDLLAMMGPTPLVYTAAAQQMYAAGSVVEPEGEVEMPDLGEDEYDIDEEVVAFRFWLPVEMEALWLRAEEACRIISGDDFPDPGDCLEAYVDAFLGEWAESADKVIRQHPVFTRDSWKCAIPTCQRRVNLQAHHIKFRSHGGGDQHGNLITLCEAHHQQGIHQGWVEVTGQAPDKLLWVLGRRQGETPFLVLRGDGYIVRQFEG